MQSVSGSKSDRGSEQLQIYALKPLIYSIFPERIIFMYIIVAIIAFGILIAIHELGHFTAAKLLDVKVNEFAIGMGPKLLKKQGKETLYTLRALPFGGFCAMEGENEGSIDPRAFTSKKRWRRIVILIAGGAANLITAFIIILIVTFTSGTPAYLGTTVAGFAEGFPNEGIDGLMVGDTIVSINGEHLYYAEDFSMFMQLANRSGYADLVIRRDGETISLNRFPLRQQGAVIVDIVDDFVPNTESSHQLLIGDIITSINGESVYSIDDFSAKMELAEERNVDIVVRRSGEDVTLGNFPLRRHDYMTNGQIEHRFGLTFNQSYLSRSLYFNQIEANAWERLSYSVYTTLNNVRLIRVSIAMLITGAAGVQDMGGPVAIVDMMNTIGQQSPTFWDALANIAGFTAFIGVNLAIVNLLPIPALDGGRIFFTLITWIIEKTTRRRLDPKYEGYINGVAFILLLAFMGFMVINDVMRIVNA